MLRKGVWDYYYEYVEGVRYENLERLTCGDFDTLEVLPKHEAIKRGIVRKPEFKVFSQEEYAKRKWF